MSRHQLSNDAELLRAARNLIQAHSSHAAAVAQKRAAYLDECGETLMADTWRQIGEAVRMVEAGGPSSTRPRRSVRERSSVPDTPAMITPASDLSGGPPAGPRPFAGA